MFRGPEIVKKDGALGAKGVSEDNIAGMVCGGVLPLTGTYIALGTTVVLIQASDADALGFNAAYDATNKVLVRYHINEFFRICPQGTLYLMVVAQTVTLAQMATNTNTHAQKLVIDSGKKIKNIGLIRNPAVSYVPVLLDGLDADVLAAVPLAQALVTAFNAQNVFIDAVIIEGREFNGTIGLAKDLRTMASPNVGICILQDKNVALLDTLYAKHASVGTTLGSIALREVEEDLGSLQAKNNPNKGTADMPIDAVASNSFLKIAVSSGVLTSALSANDVQVLKNKGYIFADNYPEYPGVFFSGSPACTLITSDFAYLVNARVWNKAARKAVYKLTPKINSTVEIDDSGKIKATTIAAWETDVNNSRDGLGTLVVDGHCLKTKCYINPNQLVNVTPKVTVGLSVKPYGYAREIVGELSFGI